MEFTWQPTGDREVSYLEEWKLPGEALEMKNEVYDLSRWSIKALMLPVSMEFTSLNKWDKGVSYLEVFSLPDKP